MAKRKTPTTNAPIEPEKPASTSTSTLQLTTASCWKCRRHLDVRSMKQVRSQAGRDVWECSHAQSVKTCKHG